MKLMKSIVAIALMATALTAWSHDDIKNTEFNPVTTGVTSLSITPDARGASMGDLGAATEPDVNSQFWNPSKYAFAYSRAGVSLSYTPWLRKIVNDIYLANLSGYYKVGGNDNQAVSASLRYFSLGEVMATDGEGALLSTINPFEMSVDVGYSRKLSEKFSMGVALRYIYSDLGYSDMNTGDQTSSASAFSADISGYYTTYPIIGRNECQWSLGFNVSNIGSKVSYNKGNDPAYLPANIRLGTSFTFPVAEASNLPKDSHAWFLTMLIFSLVGLALLIFCFSQTKERVVMAESETKNVKVSDLWTEFMRNRPLRIIALFFITAFAMMSVGNAAGAYFMNDMEVLAPQVQEGIRWLVCVIPAILLILAMFIISKYELSDEMVDKINKEIEKRHHE